MRSNCTKSLTLQKAASSQTSLVLSADLCYSQDKAVWRGLTVEGNSFSPETEEDKFPVFSLQAICHLLTSFPKLASD